MCWLAEAVARLMAVAKRSSLGGFGSASAVVTSWSTTSIAIALAISPAAAPPIPSATMNSVPRSPTACVRTSGWRVALPRDRSATTNASSLCSRVRPTSVRPKTWTTTAGRGEEFGADWLGAVTRSGAFAGLEAVAQLVVQRYALARPCARTGQGSRQGSCQGSHIQYRRAAPRLDPLGADDPALPGRTFGPAGL